jgi:hypothetical protein
MQKNCIQGFGCKTVGKILLGKPTHTQEDNIKVDLKETGWRRMVTGPHNTKWFCYKQQALNML